MESEKQNKWTNITKQNQSHRYRKQTRGCRRVGDGEVKRSRWGGLKGSSFQLQNKGTAGYEMYGVGNIHINNITCLYGSVQFSSVAQSCPTLCDPMNCSTPGLPVHHQLSEFTQTHVHWVGDAIQPSHPVVPFFSCPQSLPASGSFPMSQLFAWGGQSIGVSASASVLPVNTQDWSPLGWTG